MEITALSFYVAAESLPDEVMTDEELVEELEAQRNLMVSVSTGGPRINELNEEYKVRRERIRAALVRKGLEDPNPYSDLWAWYGKWSSGDLPTYQARRKYLSDLFAPLIENVKRGPSAKDAEVFEEPTGWARVDRGLGEVRSRLEATQTEEQSQAVGLLSREVLISLAQTVYDPVSHPSPDGMIPSQTDAKRMLEGYIAKELAGTVNEVLRRYARACLDLEVTSIGV